MRKSTMMKAALAASALFASTSVFAQDKPAYETGMIPAEHIMVPDSEILASVFLISDADDNVMTKSAPRRWLQRVPPWFGIDFKEYLKALEADDDECIYMISDIESLSQQIQRAPPAPAAIASPFSPASARAERWHWR